MLDAFSQINWVAAVIAIVASAVMGGVYFGALVPKQYLATLGRTEAPKPGLVGAVGPLVCGALNVLASAVLVAGLGLSGAGEAIVFGLVVGIGYLTAMTFQIAINPNFPHPIRYGVLNAPYFIFTSLVTSLLLVLV